MTEKPIYLLATGAIPRDVAQTPSGFGLILDSMEFTRTESLTDIPGMQELIARRLTVAFTSVNAVNAVEQSIKGLSPDWRIYCISGATSDAASALFGEQAILGTAPSASQLAELIREREAEAGTGIIFFCGDLRRSDLPSIGVSEVIVYRTVLTPRQIERDYDGIAFFSPSAVESFFSVNRISSGVALFAIGSTTAAAIQNRCANPVVVSKRPDKTLLIRQMIDFILNKR